MIQTHFPTRMREIHGDAAPIGTSGTGGFRRVVIAFTLIELLVVVAIIVILLAVLTPAMEKALGAAESARCMATTRALAVGMVQYTLDHQRRVIHVQAGRGVNWWHKLAPYVGYPNFAKQPLVNTGNYHDDQSPPFMDCPSTEEKIDQTSTYMGTRDDAWGVDYSMGSYGLNLWVANYPGWNDEFPERYSKYGDAPSHTPLLGDSIWFGGWPHEDDFDSDNYASGNSDHTRGYQMNRWVINRHGFAVNMSFVDGSAANVELGHLWALPWYRDYKGSARELTPP